MIFFFSGALKSLNEVEKSQSGNAVESIVPFVINLLLVVPRDDILNSIKLAIYFSVLGAFKLQKWGMSLKFLQLPVHLQ